MPKINLVVSVAAKAKLEKAAAKAGVGVSEYLREKLDINDVRPGRPAVKAARKAVKP